MPPIETTNSNSGIKLIAKLANVSIGTVDRVLHNRPGVAKETREKVLKIIEELDYKPNIIARRLVSKKKYRFAVLLPEATPEVDFWNMHQKGIRKAEEELQPLGVFIDRFTFQLDNAASFADSCGKIAEGNYDGILLDPIFRKEAIELVQHCHCNNIPFVYFDTNLECQEADALSYIGQDAFQSGYFAGKLVSYFLGNEDTALSVSLLSSRKEDDHLNAHRRAAGFKAFRDEKKSYQVEELEFIEQRGNDFPDLLLNHIQNNQSIKLIFVTNYRAYKIASILERNNIQGIKIIGYDLMDANLKYLNNGMIDFLISQDPVNQGYQGIMSLYSHLILCQKVEKQKLMPIHLILKENLDIIKK